MKEVKNIIKCGKIKPYKFNKKITVLETFAGIGSQRKALDRLAMKYNLNIDYLPPIEFDKFAIASYNAIHGTNHKIKDITQTKGTEYGQIDLFTYSFPCQDISIAGKQKGFNKGSGTRSGLLWEVERILKEMKHLPQVLLMENVKNLISKKFIDDFNEWQRELENLGYINYWQVLNAKDYGIPQNRERVFMVSILGEYSYTFPQPEPLKLRLKDMLESEVDEKYYISQEKIVYMKNTNFAQSSYDVMVQNPNSACNTLLARDYKDPKCVEVLTSSDDVGVVSETICINSKVNGKQPSLQDRIYDSEGISTALTTGFMPSIINNLRIRKLTPLEYIRLMGFDDEDYYKMIKVNSNTQIYKQCGNSIVVRVLEKIFEELVK